MRQELEELLERWPVGSQLELNNRSVVYIVGAYKGITAELIHELYHPELIRCFEPQDWAFKVLTEVVLANPDSMEAYNYALGDRQGIFTMGEWGTDACSFINTGLNARQHGEAPMIPIDWAMDDLDRIDLAMINCEGYEFKLLPYMRERLLLHKVRGLCIQWHMDLSPEYTEAEMNAEIDRLIVQDDYVMRFDDRPAWTYLTKVRD